MTDTDDLTGSWVHAHEQDHDGLQVFRSSEVDLPPSRGRTSFTLRPDGTASAGLPGPDDRGVSSGDGTWHLSGDLLEVACPGWVAAFHVVAAEGSTLELRPT